jgi:hypothetical protein
VRSPSSSPPATFRRSRRRSQESPSRGSAIPRAPSGWSTADARAGLIVAYPEEPAKRIGYGQVLTMPVERADTRETLLARPATNVRLTNGLNG